MLSFLWHFDNVWGYCPCDSDSEERCGHKGISEPIIGLRKAAPELALRGRAQLSQTLGKGEVPTPNPGKGYLLPPGLPKRRPGRYGDGPEMSGMGRVKEDGHG
ncbi:hypothetical protein HKBW3S43_01124 [Candidatus Hakubella thermalkaliphila]|uniref:Uncharacterized protein n=2 Tax=Candidatus Hakubella thermalkaliphila TaxID=2754717 RepID=A0A6V8PRS9_9ACTN|nr:hypothetical protein HKBW3S33_01322 [Candidatus Hakubella thermalkaliphila]GFP35332.1 hypothetical protein HKBW3S43_01124 [Candidatus Hakubella thermalkaliphila]